MRVLMIATGKCGSNSLTNAISEDHHLTWVNEPYNEGMNHANSPFTREEKLNLIDSDNVIVKCVNATWQHPNKRLTQFDDIEIRNDFFKSLSKTFDKTILLDRRNESERLFSVLHAHQHNTWNQKEKYQIKEVALNEYWIPYLEGACYQKDSINKLSEDLSLPIHRLEDFCTENYELSEKTYNDIIGVKKCKFSHLYDTYFNPKHKQGNKNT
jgi:hypothetical protein